MDTETKAIINRAIGYISSADLAIEDAYRHIPDFARTVRGDLDRACEHLREAIEWLNTAQSPNHEVDAEIRFLARTGPVKE